MKKIVFFSIICCTLMGIIFLFLDYFPKEQDIHNYSIPNGIRIEILNHAEIFDDLFEAEQKIALKGIFIGNIKKLKIFPNGDFGIIDATTKQLNIFEENGQFLRTIGGIGNGPGEYIYPTDFLLDDSLNIYILDPAQLRIIRYSFYGQYLNSFNLDKYVEHMALFKNKLFLYSSMTMLDQPHGYCVDVRKNKKEFDFAEPNSFLKSLIKNNNLSLVVNSNSLAYYEHNIYLIHPYQYAIRRFNENGELRKTIFCDSKYFSHYDTTKQFNPLNIDPKQYFKSAVNGIKVFKNIIIISFIDILGNKVYFDFYSITGYKLNKVSIALPSNKFDKNAYFPFEIDSNNSFYVCSFESPETNGNEFNPYILKYKPLFIN